MYSTSFLKIHLFRQYFRANYSKIKGFTSNEMYSRTRNEKVPAPLKISPVTLALQLVSGERLMTEFHPTVTLWEILQHWEAAGSLSPALNSLAPSTLPVCVYLRKELVGQKTLQSSTLLDLDITSGKAAIRYVTKCEGVTEQAHVGGILAPTPRPPSPEIVPNKPAEVIPTVEQPIPTEEPKIETEKPENYKVQECKMEEAERVDISPSQPVERSEPTFSKEPANYVNERGDLVYLRPEDAQVGGDVDDDFFEVTEEEVRKMMQHLIQQNNQLNNAQFVTAQMRRDQEEQRRLQSLQKYPITILRVQFGDGLVLQTPLPSDSTLTEVKQHLKEYIEGSNDFELFTTPPKQVLEVNVPLFRLGLAPSSLIYIASHCVLKEQYRMNLSSYSAAVREAYQRLHENVEEEQRPKRIASDPAAAAKNVPKWFKLK